MLEAEQSVLSLLFDKLVDSNNYTNIPEHP